jgi:trehalose-6-phosphate synthase
MFTPGRSRAAPGEWTFERSSGGLVSALKGVRDEYKFVWIGWVGCDVEEDERPLVRETLLRDHL